MEFIWVCDTTLLDDNVVVNFVLEDDIDYDYLVDQMFQRMIDDEEEEFYKN